jgi:hypothetical protein
MHIKEPLRIVPPHAWVGHIPFAMWLVAEYQPAVVVELGVHSGNSFFAMSQSAQEAGIACTLHGIDTWEGEKHAGEYDETIWNDVSSYARAHYPDRVKLHRCLFDEALKAFAPHSVDLLHIDGLHTFDAVKHDFDTWLPKMSSRGIVLFHDIAERRDDFGVYRLWDELKQRYPSVEFSHSHGLGVLFVGQQAEPMQARLRAGGDFSPLAYLALAGKSLMDKVAGASPSRGPREVAQAVLYLGSGTPAAFAEEKKLVGEIALDGSVTSLSWTLPTAVTALRFDPAMQPVSMEVRGFSVLSAQGEVLWALQNAGDLIDNRDLIVLDQGLPPGVKLHLVCIGDDPQFKPRLPAELLPLPAGTELRLELQGREPGGFLAMGALMHGWQQTQQAMAQAMQASLHQHQATQAQWRDERAALQSQCTGLQETVSGLQHRNAQLELELKAASQQLAITRQLRGFKMLKLVNRKV